MGLKAMVAGKIGKVIKPVTKAVGKVVSKMDANKPEIMLVSGLLMVAVGTGWAIYSTTKVDQVVEESQEAKEELDAKKAEMTDKEFRKAFAKVKMDTIWKFLKLYGLPALIWLLGICDLVGGHWVLKKRYILTATSLKGMQEFMNFVKQNVIEDAGEEKWEEYAHGKVGKKEMHIETTEADGTKIQKTAEVEVCRPHDNPWRIPFTEELFKSWKADTDTNFFFLQGCEKYWNEVKYQADKDAEISIYEILDYLRIDWSKINKDYRTWLRNQVWGHHIYGDDRISFGLQMETNTPARRRQSDLIYLEFNAEGEPKDIINRYRDPAWLAKQKANMKRK